MLPQSNAGQMTGPTDSTDPAGLVLERLPSGELAWLRPDAELDRAIADADQLHQDLAVLVERCDDVLGSRRVVLTQRGTDYLARLSAWAWLGITPAEAA